MATRVEVTLYGTDELHSFAVGLQEPLIINLYRMRGHPIQLPTVFLDDGFLLLRLANPSVSKGNVKRVKIRFVIECFALFPGLHNKGYLE